MQCKLLEAEISDWLTSSHCDVCCLTTEQRCLAQHTVLSGSVGRSVGLFDDERMRSGISVSMTLHRSECHRCRYGVDEFTALTRSLFATSYIK